MAREVTKSNPPASTRRSYRGSSKEMTASEAGPCQPPALTPVPERDIDSLAGHMERCDPSIKVFSNVDFYVIAPDWRSHRLLMASSLIESNGGRLIKVSHNQSLPDSSLAPDSVSYYLAPEATERSASFISQPPESSTQSPSDTCHRLTKVTMDWCGECLAAERCLDPDLRPDGPPTDPEPVLHESTRPKHKVFNEVPPSEMERFITFAMEMDKVNWKDKKNTRSAFFAFLDVKYPPKHGESKAETFIARYRPPFERHNEDFAKTGRLKARLPRRTRKAEGDASTLSESDEPSPVDDIAFATQMDAPHDSPLEPVDEQSEEEYDAAGDLGFQDSPFLDPVLDPAVDPAPSIPAPPIPKPAGSTPKTPRPDTTDKGPPITALSTTTDKSPPKRSRSTSGELPPSSRPRINPPPPPAPSQRPPSPRPLGPSPSSASRTPVVSRKPVVPDERWMKAIVTAKEREAAMRSFQDLCASAWGPSPLGLSTIKIHRSLTDLALEGIVFALDNAFACRVDIMEEYDTAFTKNSKRPEPSLPKDTRTLFIPIVRGDSGWLPMVVDVRRQRWIVFHGQEDEEIVDWAAPCAELLLGDLFDGGEDWPRIDVSLSPPKDRSPSRLMLRMIAIFSSSLWDDADVDPTKVIAGIADKDDNWNWSHVAREMCQSISDRLME